jgi:hypothetical protein
MKEQMIAEEKQNYSGHSAAQLRFSAEYLQNIRKPMVSLPNQPVCTVSVNGRIKFPICVP